MAHATVPYLPGVFWYPDVYFISQIFPALHAYGGLEVVLVSPRCDWYLTAIGQDHGSLSAAIEKSDSVAL